MSEELTSIIKENPATNVVGLPVKLPYHRTERGCIIQKYYKMKVKSKQRGHEPPNFTREELFEWAYARGYKELYDNWALHNFDADLCPSIDRIVPRVGYTFSNIRLTTWLHNSNYNNYHRKNNTLNNKLVAVKLNKLWGSTGFTKLSTNTKFLYLYLCSHNNLSVLGVLNIPIELMSLETGLSIPDIRKASKELIDSNYLFVKKFSDNVFFIIPAHFNTLPKSDSTVMKIQKEFDILPSGLVTFLKSKNISTDRKAVKFDEPTAEEISEYAFSQGHVIDGNDVIKFYRGQAAVRGKQGIWLDTRGKQVKDWKGKLRLVWFKDENRLKTVDGAPKGFEFFHINIDGKMVFPDAWKNGQPFSKNIGINKQLKEAYEERKRNS